MKKNQIFTVTHEKEREREREFEEILCVGEIKTKKWFDNC